MGIDDLDTNAPHKMSVNDILAALEEPQREKLSKALTTRRAPGSNRYAVAASAVAQACREDGFDITKHAIEQWRHTNGY